MEQSQQTLSSPIVRKCARCNAAAMLNVSADAFNRFQCTNCGKTIDLWPLKDMLAGLAVFGGMLSLLFLDDHLFWLLLKVIANPLQEFPAMAKDGLLAPVLLPLGLVAFNILLVGLPLMGMGIILRALYLGWRHPVVERAAAAAELEGHTIVPQEKRRPFTWREFFQSLMIAIAIHAGFVTVAWLCLTFANKAVFEGFVEGALPALLLSGGLLFGVRRWMVASFWVLLLPVSGFLVYLLSG